MDAPADFKTSVLASLDRLGNVRALGSREALLLGQTKAGGWTRLRIPARYSWMEGLMVRAFIKQRRIDRMAILIADDFDRGRPRRLRLECVDPALKQDEILEAPLVAMPGNSIQPGLWALKSEGAGARLARLAAAARLEWSGVQAPMRRLLGRPWMLTFLVAICALELGVDLLRIRSALAGSYTWLPIIPSDAAHIAWAIYVALLGVTIVFLFCQARPGYALALLVSAVQFVRPIAIVVPVAHLMSVESVAWYLGASWLFPLVIWSALVGLYQDRRSRVVGLKAA
jgi:hypothetical protein